MKKFIYSLGLALAIGASANAAAPQFELKSAQKANPAEMQIQQLGDMSLTFERISPAPSKQEKRGLSTAEDFAGIYKWSGRNLLSSEVFANSGIMTISINEENPSRMIIDGFSPWTMDAYVDNRGRLVVPNQFLAINTYYNSEMWFFNWSVENTVNDEGEAVYALIQNNVSDFYFVLTATGIKAGNVDVEKWNNNTYTDAELLEDVCIAASHEPSEEIAGYFWLCMNIAGPRENLFSFSEDEWTLLGNGQFLDAWFALYWDGATPEYDVPVYCSKTEPGIYLLYAPYGYVGDENNPYSYYGLNLSDKPGFLVFDMNDFDCVRFKPLVESIVIDYRDSEEDPVFPVPCYCFNAEGNYYYVENASVDDILTFFDQNDLEVSTFNQRTNTVSINNAIFGMGSEMLAGYSWTNQPMAGYIVMPSNWSDGVESVLGEDNDAPAEYYNLQGVKVANPEKGQLLIVRKGNTATKQIIR